MDFDRIAYWDFESAVHKDTSKKNQPNIPCVLSEVKKIKNVVKPWQTKPHYSTDTDIQQI